MKKLALIVILLVSGCSQLPTARTFRHLQSAKYLCAMAIRDKSPEAAKICGGIDKAAKAQEMWEEVEK